MNISDIMTDKDVVIGVKANTKRELLQELASYASKATGLDERTLFDTLLERENLGSTGFGEGTALPHGRFENLKKVQAVFFRLAAPIDYDAIDGKPVDLVFMLLSPEDSGADHLTALAKISRLLKNESVCSKVRKMADTEDIYSLLNNEE